MRSRQLTFLMLLGVFVMTTLYFMRNPTIDAVPEAARPQPTKQPTEGQVEKPSGKQHKPEDNSGDEKAEPVPQTEAKPKEQSTGKTDVEHKEEESAEDTTHETTGKELEDKDEAKIPKKPVKGPDALDKQASKPPAVPVISGAHPVESLINEAGKEFNKMLNEQSKSLADAVTEYKRRYKMHPPPNFDKWFQYAKDHNVALIDEYDTIYDSLLPFWGVAPGTIRERVKEAVGFHDPIGIGNNALMTVTVRDGAVAMVDGGPEWQNEATGEMISKFVKYLPDMDLAFNIHDEPRVILPHDDLSRLVKRATDQILPEAFKNEVPRNKFTKAEDIGDGKDLEEYKFTKFNVFAHQPTWTHSRQSCPLDSPARSLDEDVQDNRDSWTTRDGMFIKNKTAFSDICQSPSLQRTFGFFDRPNALKIAQDLIPVFSQSKVSSFQDILYPSPWYWFGKVIYDQKHDEAWERKTNGLYWRGSTTGGFSRNGGWRRQHRQRIVSYVNRKDKATAFEKLTKGDHSQWSPVDMAKEELSSLFDVHFIRVDQCDDEDCEAQREYFTLEKEAKQNDAWKWKYLLDMDGNAFSGRFYAFLNSRCLPFKMAYFREWHEEWLKPWFHYIPLSLSGSEYFETLRYFDKEESGQKQAREVAEAGRQWSIQALRNEDLETWFFRLLLEYGRVVDDHRSVIGFADPGAPTASTRKQDGGVGSIGSD